jgi:hypothetical protein
LYFDATTYTWQRSGLYHSIISGDGRVQRLHGRPARSLEHAAIARSWGWSAADITIQRLMTHAEAASNRDGRVMHDNYGPVIWGSIGER